MTSDDYYAILDVPHNSSTRQIKAAYRRLAFQHHPDRNRDTPGSSETMKRINEAYAVLSNPAKRREYDGLRRQFGSAAHSRFRSAHSQQDIYSGSDINAVFEEMARAFGFRGFEDIFREFYGPDSQHFEFKRPGVWVRTFAFGRPFSMDAGRPSSPRQESLLGRLARLAFRRLSRLHLPENGRDIRDHIYLNPAMAAAGGPYAYFLRERSKKLVIKIPAGMREGQRIRLAGLGYEGRAGGAPGDLFLEVRLGRSIPESIKAWAARILGR
ncbi:MAG: DnaJ domain-containing protein [Hyphomicrobiales bacterium]